MRIRETSKVDRHHTNQNYVCVIVDFMNTDYNFKTRIYHNGRVADWMPTDKEVIDLFVKMFDVSPTFRTLFRDEMKKKRIVIPKSIQDFF